MADVHMQDVQRESSAQPSVDITEEEDWDAVNADGTPEADGTQDGPEESFDTEDEDDEVQRAFGCWL